MSADPELERRIAAFWAEHRAFTDFDSEFNPNPFWPQGKVKDLVELGSEAAPFLCSLATSGERELKECGVWGLEQLGPRGGDAAVAALEQAIGDDYAGRMAVSALEHLRPEHFWDRALYRHFLAIELIVLRHQAQGDVAPFIARLLEVRHDHALAAALGAVKRPPFESALFVETLRRAVMSDLPRAREKAMALLAAYPPGSPVEPLIEAAVLSGRATEGLVQRVAWHADSLALVEVLVRAGDLVMLAELLKRRRCAGLSTPAEPLRAFVEEKLRRPKRPWRAEQDEVHYAAKCALELGDRALLPALVDAVVPENGGFAWGELVNALTLHGDAARLGIEDRARAETNAGRLNQLGLMRSQLTNPVVVTVEWGDRDFIGGSIDHSTGGAFESYALALRFGGSAHAGFQLAWIDRAFGVPIVDDRVAWIRALGFRDEGLLAELTRPVVPLEGLRRNWRRCEAPDAVRVAGAGLYGLAYRGSVDPKHEQQAEAHVERVRAASLPGPGR